MKKILLVLTPLILIGCGENENITLVKNSYIDNARTIKIGKIFDERSMCQKTLWKSEKDDLGRNLISYTCTFIDDSKLLLDKRDYLLAEIENNLRSKISNLENNKKIYEQRMDSIFLDKLKSKELNIAKVNAAKQQILQDETLSLKDVNIKIDYLNEYQLIDQMNHYRYPIDMYLEAIDLMTQLETNPQERIDPFKWGGSSDHTPFSLIRYRLDTTLPEPNKNLSEIQSNQIKTLLKDKLLSQINAKRKTEHEQQIKAARAMFNNNPNLKYDSSIQDLQDITLFDISDEDFIQVLPEIKILAQNTLRQLQKERSGIQKKALDYYLNDLNAELSNFKNTPDYTKFLSYSDKNKYNQTAQDLIRYQSELDYFIQNKASLFQQYMYKDIKETLVWAINDLNEIYIIEGRVTGTLNGNVDTIFEHNSGYKSYILNNYRSKDIVEYLRINDEP